MAASSLRWRPFFLFLVVAAAVGATVYLTDAWHFSKPAGPAKSPLRYKPRKPFDISGFTTVIKRIDPWPPSASLEEISKCWRRAGYRLADRFDREAASPGLDAQMRNSLLLVKASLYNFEGEPATAYRILEDLRADVEKDDALAEEGLYTIVYLQGVTGLRIGEDENCIMCRGESSCIIPVAPSAIHTNPKGSRLAVKHFTEYLGVFPDDLEVRWLLNLAHMTLGEHPGGVDPRFVLSLDRFGKSEFNVGKFRDIGHLAGVNRLNQSGGAIMEDFDNDGLLDIVITCLDPTESMAFFHNKGDGTFEDRTRKAGLAKQLGGLYCVQADYNNDGFMDIFIVRGAWIDLPVRPTLLRNNGDGTFTDVTAEAGLLDPVNSISASWADFDNDGFLDLFICCDKQPNRLYRNNGNGTFTDVAKKAGVDGNNLVCKGSAWIDFDNDGYPDLFLNNFNGAAQLFRNQRDGTFADVTAAMGIDGPRMGFSCWAWDFDNDGWLDIFATSYSRTVSDVVKGLMGESHTSQSSKLYRNLQGKGFKDVTAEAGLDLVFAAMGSNFADFDNDGYLDFYLGTGDPNLAMLVPNRMFKNVGGKRFADISGTSGTGHLQKGHAVACGDWRRAGLIDIFIEMGGAINGDKYHNILFQNPGNSNNWLTVKLIGTKTNRAAIGARIKIVTAGPNPMTIHRLVSSGSSFGANPLQQTIGLGKTDRVALLEITWPRSGTQTFRDIAVDQAIEATEGVDAFRKLDWKPLPAPPKR